MYFYEDPKITYKSQVSFHAKLSLHYHCVSILSELKHSMKVLQPGRHQKLINSQDWWAPPPHSKLYKGREVSSWSSCLQLGRDSGDEPFVSCHSHWGRQWQPVSHLCFSRNIVINSPSLTWEESFLWFVTSAVQVNRYSFECLQEMSLITVDAWIPTTEPNMHLGGAAGGFSPILPPPQFPMNHSEA